MLICGLPQTPVRCGRYVDFVNVHLLIIQIVTGFSTCAVTVDRSVV